MKNLLLLFLPIPAIAGPFAELSLSVRESHTPAPLQFYYDKKADKVFYTGYEKFDRATANPYGNIKLGWSWKLTDSLTAALSIEHESSLATRKDKGINAARVAIRWGDE